MNLERRVSRRHALAALTVLVGGVIVPPLLHYPSTVKTLRAIFRGRVDCTVDRETQNQSYPFDAIVVPGVGNDKIGDGDYTPKRDERLRLEAAAHAFAQRLAPKIILLDGVRNPPQENGSIEKTYLLNTLNNLAEGDSGIDDGVIILGERSINTATAMEELAEIATAHNMQKVLIITNSYHEIRATLLACENGVAASHQSAESFFNALNPRIFDSWKMAGTMVKEGLEIVWAIWDPQGIIPTKLKKITYGL